MADLISKYFQEDLNEAEDQALSDTLLNSPGDSQKFEDLSREAYLRYGFPEPKWPGNPDDYPLPRNRGGGWTWAWVLLGASIAAVLAWHVLKPGNRVSPPPSRARTPHHGTSGISKLKPKAGSSLAQPGGFSTAVSSPVQDSARIDLLPMQTTSHLPSPAQEAQKNPVSPPETGISPPGSQGHSGLEVTVRQAVASQVIVRVLQEDGTQAAFLYQGVLQAGNWVFGWDGKLSNGSPASPGSYQIQVTSGSVTRSKIVFIHEHGPE